MANLVGQGAVMALLFMAGRFMYRSVGADALGIVLFGMTLSAGLSAAFDLGVAATVVREVAGHRLTDPGGALRVAQTAILTSVVLYAVLAAVTWAAVPLLAEHWLRLGDHDDPARATLVLRMVALGGLTALPRSIATALLRGIERMDLTNAIDVVAMLLQQAGIVAAVLGGGVVVAIALWLAAAQILWYLAYVPALALSFGWRAIRPRWNAEVARRAAPFALRMGIISMLAVIHTQADRAVVSFLLPVAVFGWYAFGYGVVSRATLVTGALAQAAFPSLVSLHAAGDHEMFRAHHQRLQSLLCFGTAPLFAAVPFALPPLGALVFDAAAIRALTLPMTLVAIGFYMNGTITLPYMASLAVGRPEIAMRSNVWALVVVLPTTVFLVRELGLVGAGLSWVIYHVFAYGYAVPRIAAECLRMPVADWARPVAQAAATATVVFGTAWGVVWSRGGGGVALLLAWVAACAIYAVIVLRLAGDEIRGAVRTLRGAVA